MENKIQRIFNEIPLERVLEHYGVEIRHGRIKCPIHSGKSFDCVIKNNWFHCFSCVKNFNAVTLVMSKENCDGKRAVELIGDWFLPDLNRKMTDAERRDWKTKKSVYDIELREMRETGLAFLKNFQDEIPLQAWEREKFIAEYWIPAEKKRRQAERQAEIEREREAKRKAELRALAVAEWEELDAINARLGTVTIDAYEKYDERVHNAFWKLVGEAVALQEVIEIKTHEALKAVAI